MAGERQSKMLMIDRENAIVEEIELAIDQVWSGGSIICANLLAWAAIDQLKGICKQKGISTLLGDAFEDGTIADSSAWFRMVKEAYNFAKHADRDPTEAVILPIETVYMAIMTAIDDYRRCFKKPTNPILLFRSWMMARMPEVMKDSATEEIHRAPAFFGKDATLEQAQKVWSTYKKSEVE